MPNWLQKYSTVTGQFSWIQAVRWSLFASIIILPLGHLLGIIMLLVTAALSFPAIQWRLRGQALSLCLPLFSSYLLIIAAELLSPNSIDITLETAFNYLPLLLVPIIFAGCWHSGLDIQQLITSVLISAGLMAAMALTEIYIFGQSNANGNIFEKIAIAPSEFALVAFLYGLIIALALLLNRHPFVNKIEWPWIVLGLGCCLLCIVLTSTRTMFVPIAVVSIFTVFALAFNSTKRWLAPGLLVIFVLVAVSLSGLPMVQDTYDSILKAIDQTVSEPRTGRYAEKLSKWIAGWEMAQQSAVWGHGNIHAVKIALNEFRLNTWPPFYPSFQFDNAFIDHFVLFGALGLAGLLITLMAPMVMIGPTWFRIYVAIIVLGTTLFAFLGRFLNNDITGATMLIMWLSLLLTQTLVGKRTP